MTATTETSRLTSAKSKSDELKDQVEDALANQAQFTPAAQEINIEINLYPTQRKFALSNVLTAVLCGPRREGKTVAGMARVLRISNERHERLRQPDGTMPRDYKPMKWLVIRDTFTNLERTTMETIQTWLPPEACEWEDDSHVCKFPAGAPFVEFHFLGLEHQRHWNKFQGFECGGLWIEEPAPAAEESSGLQPEVYAMGTSCLSQKDCGYFTQITMNPPDDEHWTYLAFWERRLDSLIAGDQWKMKADDINVWEIEPGENRHVTDEYRAQMRAAFMAIGRMDLMERMAGGKVVHVQQGEPVAPNFSARLHVAEIPLEPLPGIPLVLLWDFGLHPCCSITQITPLRRWHFLNTFQAENDGVENLIVKQVLPEMMQRMRGYEIRHIGDVAGRTPEQTNSERSAVQSVLALIPGAWRDGPIAWDQRRNATHKALSLTSGGYATVQIDKNRNNALIKALRGRWRYHRDANRRVNRQIPIKDIHSHPGDCFAAGAGVLFPPDYDLGIRRNMKRNRAPAYFPRTRHESMVIGGPGRPIDEFSGE